MEKKQKTLKLFEFLEQYMIAFFNTIWFKKWQKMDQR